MKSYKNKWGMYCELTGVDSYLFFLCKIVEYSKYIVGPGDNPAIQLTKAEEYLSFGVYGNKIITKNIVADFQNCELFIRKKEIFDTKQKAEEELIKQIQFGNYKRFIKTLWISKILDRDS